MLQTTVVLAALLLNPQTGQSQSKPGEKPWKIRITAEKEPGIPMVVTGKVVDQDGKALKGVKVYVYHTDNTGIYQVPGKTGSRLNGTMWTNADGKFEYRTIRPAPYPGSKTGEHFHLELSEGGIQPHFSNIEFYEDEPKHKLVVSTGLKGGSASHDTSFAWKPDKEIKGQRLDVVIKVRK